MFGTGLTEALDNLSPSRSDNLVKRELRGTRFKVQIQDISKYLTKNPKMKAKMAGKEYVKMEVTVLSAEQLPPEASAELEWEAAEGAKRFLGQKSCVFCENYAPHLDADDNKWFFRQMVSIAVGVGRFKLEAAGKDVDLVRSPADVPDSERKAMQEMLSEVIEEAFDPEKNAFGGGEIYVDLVRSGDEGQYANVKFASVA